MKRVCVDNRKMFCIDTPKWMFTVKEKKNRKEKC